jgi:hypothetical protein
MLTAELPLLDRVKVNHAEPAPTATLPKLYVDGLRVTVWAMSPSGARNDTASRVNMR